MKLRRPIRVEKKEVAMAPDSFQIATENNTTQLKTALTKGPAEASREFRAQARAGDDRFRRRNGAAPQHDGRRRAADLPAIQMT
jgi:hypothetical protein